MEMNEMNIHGMSDLYLLCGEDLNKMIALTRYVMKTKPNLNEGMMDWLSYLNTIKPHEIHEVEGLNNLDNNHSSLDEIIWELGMNLPSWDDDLPDGK